MSSTFYTEVVSKQSLPVLFDMLYDKPVVGKEYMKYCLTELQKQEVQLYITDKCMKYEESQVIEIKDEDGRDVKRMRTEEPSYKPRLQLTDPPKIELPRAQVEPRDRNYPKKLFKACGNSCTQCKISADNKCLHKTLLPVLNGHVCFNCGIPMNIPTTERKINCTLLQEDKDKVFDKNI